MAILADAAYTQRELAAEHGLTEDWLARQRQDGRLHPTVVCNAIHYHGGELLAAIRAAPPAPPPRGRKKRDFTGLPPRRGRRQE